MSDERRDDTDDADSTDVATRAEIDGGVLVGHDGSPAADDAVEWAGGLAARLGVSMHVLRAWSLTNAPRPAAMTGGYIPPLDDFQQAVLDAVRADLAALELPEGLDVQVHAAHAKPSAALLEAAAGAELLVVASRGAGGFRGLGFGSTADQVVRHSPCPVVVVPQPKD